MCGSCVSVILVAFTLLASACGPSVPAPTNSGSATNPAPSQPQAPKTLVISQDFEPPDIEGFGSNVRPAGSGGLREIVHNHLTRKIRDGVIQPELVTELPSVERGTWRVNADSTMDVTWKLRPNVKWQDGTPFTSADLLFSLDVYKNSALPPTAAAGSFRLMESATAPDDTTFIVHYSQVDAAAPEAAGFGPLPRHLMEELYTTDKDAFVNSSRFRNEWVGLGPYRLVTWQLGSQMELARFDQYFDGRPPFDTVTIRFIQDANTTIAALLSGAVDVAVRPRVPISASLEVKQRWEEMGNQAWIETSGRVHYGEAQRRPDVAKPRNGLTDPLVRRAFYTALDRQGLSEAFTQGYAPVADSYVAPDDPLRRQVESAIMQYPYDPNAAQRLLAEAGWNRGPDGTLVHKDTGDVFESEVWSAPESSQPQEATLMAGQWSALGARLTSYAIPVARVNDRELAAHSPLFTVSDGQAPSTWFTPDRLHSRFIASPANNWGGRNKFGNNNGRLDDLVERLQLTVDDAGRVNLHRQLLDEESRDLTFFPIYWEVISVFAARGVTPAPNRPYGFPQFVAWTRD